MTKNATTYFFLCFVLLCSLSGYAQKEKMKNLQFYDYHILHFGFSLGLNKTNFNVQPRDNFYAFDSLYVIESIPQNGFNIGIVSDLRLGEYLNLRFIPGLSFPNRQINYTFVTPGKTYTHKKQVESTFLYFPLNLKYKSARHNNYRVYVMGGANFAYDLASKADAVEDLNNPIRLRKNDLLYEFGVGIDIYFEYFKFSPELKYSIGTFNMLEPSKNIYSNALKGLTSRVFLLSFTFE